MPSSYVGARAAQLSWIGFNLVNGGTARSAYTSGLRDFGLLEIEVRDSMRECGDLLEFLANIAHHEITSGIQIGDRETLGGSEYERFMVRHTASQFMRETKVACIGA